MLEQPLEPGTSGTLAASHNTNNAGLDGSKRALNFRAKLLRGVEATLFKVQHHTSRSGPSPKPSRMLEIEPTFTSRPGKIGLAVWRPASADAAARLPVVVDVHGGGFTIGHASDDAKWAHAIVDNLPAVVVSVDFRAGPEHAYPTAVEDCADAVLWVAAHAAELGVDADQMFISGFSCGGTLCLASYLLLQTPQTWGYPAVTPPRVRGILSFYPMLDNTRSRDYRRQHSVDPQKTLPPAVTDIFDAAYYSTVDDYTDARCSPGLAVDALLDTLPPVHLVLCELDMLMQEGLDFAERLRQRGKSVTVRVVRGEEHGFDKPPPVQPKPCVGEEYAEAVAFMARALKGDDLDEDEGLSEDQEELRRAALD